MELQSVSLHGNEQYLEQCAQVLNEEWPRSMAARVHTLEKSSDKMPYSLVLLRWSKGDSGPPQVIGHARLSKVHGQNNACFVESVVVKKNQRGKGLGRRLMDEAEIHAKRLRMDTIYLTTHDKQDFYTRLGYQYCKPIISLGGASNLLSEKQLEQLFGNGISNSEDRASSKKQGNIESQGPQITGKCPSTAQTTQGILPPPAPPPPPVSAAKPEISRMPSDKIYWLKKELNV